MIMNVQNTCLQARIKLYRGTTQKDCYLEKCHSNGYVCVWTQQEVRGCGGETKSDWYITLSAPVLHSLNDIILTEVHLTQIKIKVQKKRIVPKNYKPQIKAQWLTTKRFLHKCTHINTCIPASMVLIMLTQHFSKHVYIHTLKHECMHSP